ncbi:MAG: serine/threonine protein kinase, partial [Planctomycetota bacterium]
MSVASPAPREPSLPPRVGPYLVEALLGRGGVGVVYRARDERSGRSVAVKVLQGGDAEDRLRFAREARAAARLRGPGIVAVVDVGQHGGHPYLVMELVEGESLQARLERTGPLPPEEAARVLEGVARAVARAHAQGILHRDLKPANVLLDREGTPWLTDFGLARRVGDEAERLTLSGTVLGTPAFLPPEQALGDRARVGPQSDVYGLGATLYAALTGRPPFPGRSVLAVLARVVEEAPPAPRALRPELPPELEALCLACLAKDPAARPAGAATFADALAAWR